MVESKYVLAGKPKSTTFLSIVSGLSQYEADTVLSYMVVQCGNWGEFWVTERKEEKPGFPSGWELNYRSKIYFHPCQAIEIKSYAVGFIAGLRA